MPAIALLTSGSNCVSVTAPGTPAKYCLAEIGRESFSEGFSSITTPYASMVASEILLFITFSSRSIKLFTWCSEGTRLILRKKPGAVWKRLPDFNSLLVRKKTIRGSGDRVSYFAIVSTTYFLILRGYLI